MKKLKQKIFSISLALMLFCVGMVIPPNLQSAYAVTGGISLKFQGGLAGTTTSSVSDGSGFQGGTDIATTSLSSTDTPQPEIIMAVHFIDVGQGLAILVQSGGQNLVYDGGDKEHANEVVSYLQQQNVQNIDYMVSSHYDEDHVSGLIDCINNFTVSNIIGADYAQDSNVYTEFMDTASSKGLEVRYPFVGDSYSFGTGSFTILAPDGINANDSNNNSVAIKLENGSNSFIFTGDAEETSEQDMISTGMNLDCDVLCVGHHGSASSTTWDFLEATSPAYAVVSCGIDNQYDHPSAETMGRLSDMEIPVFRTDKQGTVIAVSDGTSITWTAEPCNDYSSGEESSADFSAETTNDSSYTDNTTTEPETVVTNSATVWLSATGEKYHSIPNCGRMNPDKARQVSEADAIAQGYTACSKCFQYDLTIKINKVDAIMYPPYCK